MRAVDLIGVHIEEGIEQGSVLVLLQERDEPHRVLPLAVGGLEATAIVLGATDTAAPRPLTHDLMAALVEHLGARLERVEVTELDGATFLADLVLDGEGGASRVDARPSDAIALALRAHAPLFVSEEVLDEAGAMMVEVDDDTDAELDPERIQAELDEFRDFLADVDPGDFGTPDGD